MSTDTKGQGAGTKGAVRGSKPGNDRPFAKKGHKPSYNTSKKPGGAASKSGGKPGVKPQPRRKTAREVALDTLVKVAEAGAYSNLQLNRALQDAELSRQDAGLVTELVYGTIQHQRLLDERLNGLITKGFHKLTPWVLALLRMSAYQLLLLDRIPPHAAVNEAVVIAKRRGHSGISGMVNGVLRNMERSLAELKQPIELADPVKRIGINYSYPDWLVKRWIDSYGEEAAEQICAAGNEPPHSSLRVNPLKLSRDSALRLLAEEGYDASPSAFVAEAVVVSGGGNLAQSSGYGKGLWTLQDESSMLVADVCAPAPGMRVLDCCAAPGGKTTHLAELMGDKGEVIANDVHPHKKQLIDAQAERLGLRIVQAVTGDAMDLPQRYAPESFDVVLLDAPCSGFGVIRRKPEIKWTKSEIDVAAIAEMQAELLNEAAKLVRPGGTLVYSTCTIEREENEEQVMKFLQRHESFSLDVQWPEQVIQPLSAKGAVGEDFGGMVQLLPQQFGSDGFFIARMRRQS
ncbi:16S rRNA (cytosine(967)-C(5))-methyltransferase RsmB [Paenibacillus sp. R14(2021)]|uniref:16S rRNA (cytosine(967)-C(5))-methyltransferase RsmB n=1 Tax=Paenibacillus sp. R14(2021) TaxID=2859228 RepID=UPI001C6141A2|nr:16S rRNA (cytosine(967)-C(5))-methyltransferase RsmB [Paenibacillus sp. R14(2021)]